jgi:hypothetical protein
VCVSRRGIRKPRSPLDISLNVKRCKRRKSK